MLRPVCALIFGLFSIVLSAGAQSPDPTPAQPAAQPQDAAPPPEAKKPKKIVTNEDLHKSAGELSVVGGAKQKPKKATSQTPDAQYVASVRKQLDTLQKQIVDVDKQLVDLKNFSEGDPSNNAVGIKLNKNYNREPIEVQMRELQDKKKDLQTKMDALLDEARKKGVTPGDLR